MEILSSLLDRGAGLDMKGSNLITLYSFKLKNQESTELSWTTPGSYSPPILAQSGPRFCQQVENIWYVTCRNILDLTSEESNTFSDLFFSSMQFI